MSTRTVSARIDSTRHEQIIEICNRKGMTVNQFICWLIDGLITSNSDRDGKILYQEM